MVTCHFGGSYRQLESHARGVALGGFTYGLTRTVTYDSSQIEVTIAGVKMLASWDVAYETSFPAGSGGLGDFKIDDFGRLEFERTIPARVAK